MKCKGRSDLISLAKLCRHAGVHGRQEQAVFADALDDESLPRCAEFVRHGIAPLAVARAIESGDTYTLSRYGPDCLQELRDHGYVRKVYRFVGKSSTGGRRYQLKRVDKSLSDIKRLAVAITQEGNEHEVRQMAEILADNLDEYGFHQLARTARTNATTGWLVSRWIVQRQPGISTAPEERELRVLWQKLN